MGAGVCDTLSVPVKLRSEERDWEGVVEGQSVGVGEAVVVPVVDWQGEAVRVREGEVDWDAVAPLDRVCETLTLGVMGVEGVGVEDGLVRALPLSPRDAVIPPDTVSAALPVTLGERVKEEDSVAPWAGLGVAVGVSLARIVMVGDMLAETVNVGDPVELPLAQVVAVEVGEMVLVAVSVPAWEEVALGELVMLALREAVEEALEEGRGVPLVRPVLVAHWVLEPLGVPEETPDLLGVEVRLTVSVARVEGESAPPRMPPGEALPEGEAPALVEGVAEVEAVVVALTVPELWGPVGLTLALGERLRVGVLVGVHRLVRVVLALGVLERVVGGEALAEGEWELLGVAEEVMVPRPPLDTLAVWQGVPVWLAEAVGLSLPLLRALRVTRGLAEVEKVTVTVAVPLMLVLALGEELGHTVALGVVLLLRVPVGLGVALPVQVPLAQALWLTVEHREAVGLTLPLPCRPLPDTLPDAVAAEEALALTVLVLRAVAVAALALGRGVPDTESVMVWE